MNEKTVLIVDDTPANIDILLEILGSEYEVEVATDGLTALESVEDSIPDIILLDIMMPNMDGYEVCRRLKSQERTNSIPIIFITAMSEENDEVKGFKLGASDYITKPFSPEIVKQRVKSTLKLEDKTRELESLAGKLSKYLSPQVYVSIFRGEKDVKIESKRKKMTVFFSDIVNFTSTTEGMETEDLTDLLNSYLEEMSSIAIKYGGTIDKFIGDAMLIFFGDPLSLGVKEDAIACISMAIEMRNRLKELQSKWYSYGVQNPFQVRAGITTGYCTVGNFGSKNRMDYTIIGNQVNIASRLESKAQPDQILISHETQSLIQESILCIKEGPIKVKGINHPIETYQVLDHKDNLDDENQDLTAKLLMEDAISIKNNSKISDLYAKFKSVKELDFVIILSESVPLGVLRRSTFMESMEDPIIKEELIKGEVNQLTIESVTLVDVMWPVREIINRIKNKCDNHLYDPVIVTNESKYVGVIPSYKLLNHFLGGLL